MNLPANLPDKFDIIVTDDAIIKTDRDTKERNLADLRKCIELTAMRGYTVIRIKEPGRTRWHFENTVGLNDRQRWYQPPEGPTMTSTEANPTAPMSLEEMFSLEKMFEEMSKRSR